MRHTSLRQKGLASDTVKGNFKLLEDAAIISQELARKMESMVGFRNIAMHDYKAIDKGILKSILVNNLRDLEDFYTTVLLHFKMAAE